MWSEIWTNLKHAQLADALDILLIAFVIYYFLLLIKETRAYQLAWGLSLVTAIFFFTRLAHLTVSSRLLESFINYLIIAVIVLFQGEIRRFLTGLGSRTFRKPFRLRSFREKVDDVCVALDYLSQKRIGALIAIEREISLSPYADRGQKVDAVLSKDLLVSIFFPRSPLHDGAVVIQGDKIVAAGCLLPLPAAHNLVLGFQTRTRHLAAIGLTQETDAAVIVVSEESGDVSLGIKGTLTLFEDRDLLKERLLEYLGSP
jgi:diadenylate cyclase